jgi:hypothetical protein
MSAIHTWKTWWTKEVDWGLSPSVPHVLHQAIMSLLAKRWKERSPTWRTKEVDWGIRLGHSLYGWKGNFIELPMTLVLIGTVARNVTYQKFECFPCVNFRKNLKLFV